MADDHNGINRMINEPVEEQSIKNLCVLAPLREVFGAVLTSSNPEGSRKGAKTQRDYLWVITGWVPVF